MNKNGVEDLLPVLDEELKLMDRAAEILNHSYQKCKNIGIPQLSWTA